MSYTPAVGATNYTQMPYQTQAAYQTTGVAPTQNNGYRADAYQARYQQQGPMQAPQAKEPYSVVNKSDVAFGVAGAVGGFFLAGMVGLSGPIGALILGIALLAISAGMRAIKHNKEQKATQQPAVHPGFQQQNYQPQYQNNYAPQNGMSQQQQQYQYPQAQQPAPQMNMQYAQSYQQYQGRPQAQQPTPNGYPQQQAGYPQQQQQSMWDKFLSWL